LVVLMVATVGLWGCSQGESKTSHRQDEKVKVLQAKCGNLESDCLALTSARDEAQRKLVQLESERTKLLKELQANKHACESLQAAVTIRTAETESYRGQLDELRKGIRSLLSRVESSLPAEDAGKGPILPKG
jgi:chromosome segregation ATPase